MTKVNLAWSASLTTGSTYSVDRCDTGNPAGSQACNWNTIASGIVATNYTDNMVFGSSSNWGHEFKYRIQASKNGLNSSFSNTASTFGITPFDYQETPIDQINTQLSHLPLVFSLGNNYPNPFTQNTSITVNLPESSQVKLVIYDTMGRIVAILINEHLSAGVHQLTFNKGNLPSGIYIYSMKANDFSEHKQMIILN